MWGIFPVKLLQTRQKLPKMQISEKESSEWGDQMTGNGFWWCTQCHEEVIPSRVSKTNCHFACGQPVIWIELDIPPKSERRVRPCFGCIHCDDSSELCQIEDMVGGIYWKRNNAFYESEEEPSDELGLKVASQIPCDWHIVDKELKALMEALP